MKKFCLFFFIFFFQITVPAIYSQTSVNYAGFGDIKIYKPAAVPDALVLFISGDGGWESGVVDMAMQLAAKGAMVAGIDIIHYLGNLKKLQEKCYYPAGDFESLSLYLQKKFEFHDYLKPIIVGYSSGATLAYGILAQAPANTFKAAISLGFCPDFESDKPLCTGNGLVSHILKAGKSWYLDPYDKLTAPFIVLLGVIDQVCSYADTESYLKKIHHAELVPLPKVGHGFSVQKNWLPQFITAYEKVKEAAPYSGQAAEKNQIIKPAPEKMESILPLVLVPAAGDATKPIVLLITGDGGWTNFEKEIAERLSGTGVPVVGLDSQKYFWHARTPDETSVAVTQALRQYLREWNRSSFVICGYSFGADIVPYILTRLPADLDPSLKSAVMLSPDPSGDFEIHIADMLNMGKNRNTYDVPSELKKSLTKNIVCIFGDEENVTPQKPFKESGAEIRYIPGNHHYKNNYDVIVREISDSFK